MSKFTSLLRKSSSVNLNNGGDHSNGTSPDSSLHTPFGDITNERVIEPDEVKTYEKNLNDTKSLLSDLIKNAKVFFEKGESFSKNQVRWCQSFSKDYEKSTSHSNSAQNVIQQYQQQQQQEGSVDNNVGFTKALEQFSSSITKTAGFELDFSNSVMEGFIKPIQGLIAIIEEKKVYRKKFDKAFTEYDNIIGKIKNQQTAKKIDILKLYNYEREKSKLKSNYEAVKVEYIQFLVDTQNRMHTDYIDILCSHFDSLSLFSGNAYTEYAGIKTYIDSLRTWCLSEQEFFQKDVKERDEKRLYELAREEDAKYQPIVDLLITPPFYLMKLMNDVRKNELFPPPLPPNTPSNYVPPVPIPFVPNLVRLFESRAEMSTVLCHMVSSDLPNISVQGVVLGQDVIGCEFVEECANLIAVPYMKYLFDQSITNIVSFSDKYRPSSQQGIDNLIMEFNYIMNIFKDSIEYLPPPFKKASLEIKSGLHKLSPSSSHPPIGCFLLGRVFAPCVRSPHTHGLFNVIPSDQALEACSFLSSMFYYLGGNQNYISSQIGSAQLNDTLNAWKDTLNQFFESVQNSDLTEWDPCVSLQETYLTDIPIIKQFLKQHYSSISNSYLSRNDREIVIQFSAALGQLEADDPPSEKHSKVQHNLQSPSEESTTTTTTTNATQVSDSE
ncbi:hypothetical protein CYY_001865 [Polysphondylium violaceum]|uniref:Ras-GAP domain-containing protein n=1 Tax=Polysphondylium violaceum TaxID=133409 RepID=A0A8J4Q170_9MYCE|nr:hypothetical protein CYY_001865 [Polysphondylium violaceum]